jgi:hypothetical protein
MVMSTATLPTELKLYPGLTKLVPEEHAVSATMNPQSATIAHALYFLTAVSSRE